MLRGQIFGLITSYDPAAKALRSALTLNQDPTAAANACQDKKLAQISAHLNVFASNRSPLAVIKNIVVLLAFRSVFVHHPLLAHI